MELSANRECWLGRSPGFHTTGKREVQDRRRGIARFLSKLEVNSSSRHVVPVHQALGTVLLGLALVLPVSLLTGMHQETFPICSLSRTLVSDCPGCWLPTKQETKVVKLAQQHDLIG